MAHCVGQSIFIGSNQAIIKSMLTK
uniref:Uncharacterized protein n=1 Tax=Anguilla anguilla TaxID=7936 RepID=A0A0E9SAK9_ANGAN